MTINFTPNCALLSASYAAIKKKLPVVLTVFCACVSMLPLLANTGTAINKMPADASYVSRNRIVTPVNSPKEDPLVSKLVQGALAHNPYKEKEEKTKEQAVKENTNSLGAILNPDGTIKPGIEGSYNARGFKMRYMADGSPRFMDEHSNFNCDAQWSTNFNGLGANNNLAAIAVFGGNLYVGGSFTAIGSQSYSYLAMWDGSNWKSIGTLAGGAVQAFAVSGSKLYIGGLFTSINGSTANRLAVWDGTTLSPIVSASSTNGVNTSVYALAVSGNMLYVGGNSMSVDGVVNYIISLNLSTNTWVAMGSNTVYGLNSTVRAIAVSGNNVYVGGLFTTFNNSSSPVTINRVIVWNTQTSTWSTLTSGGSTGVGGSVYAIAINGNSVYVGGSFTTAGNVTVNNIACWDQSANSWSALTDTNTSINGVTGTSVTVYSLAVSSGMLYVGGLFSSAGGNSISNIAIWQGTQWTAMGSGTSTGTTASATAYAIAVNGSNVYAGGSFFLAGGVVCNRIAAWNGSSWASIDNAGTNYGNGLNGTVYAIAKNGNDIYVGGNFISAGNVAVNYVAKWDGSSWSALGTGVSGATTNIVNALAISGNNLYVGGTFTTAGGVSAANIAIWNMQTSTWSAMGSGLGTSTATVNAIAVSGSNIYAGGNFTTSGSNTMNRVAMWNGSTWVGMDSGVSGTVYAITVSGSNVYVGGSFATAGSSALSVGSIAVWNGTSWGALGTGTVSAVYCIAVAGGNVYVGGNFVTIGTATSANGTAYWNGSSWNKMSTGINTNGVYAITAIGSSIYIAGGFTTAGGATNKYVSLWNGSAWVSLGTGLNQTARAIITDGTKLYIGGQFTIAGTAPAAGFTIFTPAPCWTGATSNAWETASNWDDGTGPQTGSDAVIPASGVTNEPTLSTSVTIKNLTVQSGRTLTLSGSNTLGVSGTLTNAATITGTGTLVLNGTSAQTIADSTGTINNLTLNNTAGATIGSGSNDLTITGVYTPTAGTLTTNSNLILASTATATAKVAAGSNSGGYISGPVTVQRYLKTNTGGYGSRRWWFLSAPVASSSNLTLANSWQQSIYLTGTGSGGSGSACSDGMTSSQPGVYSNGFDITGANTPSLYNYNDNNATGSKWTAFTGTNGTNYVTAGAGYRVLVRGDRNVQGCALLVANPPAPGTDVVLSATGNLQQGSLALNLGKTTANGFNFIGNPYPSEISFTAFQTTNNTLTNSYWTYYPDNAAGTYSVYSAGSVTNVPASYNLNPAIIAPGQAFFIQNNTSTSSITFNESHKSGSTQYGLFGANDNNMPSWDARVRIGLLTNDSVATRIDEAIIRFGTQVSSKNEYNNNWDALSLNEGSQYIQTLKDSDRLAIQTRNQWFTNDTVLLNIKSGTANLKLYFTEFAGIPNQEIYLIDKYTHTTQKISDNPVYTFAVTAKDSASYGSNRFMIVFGNGKPVVSNTPDCMVYPNPVTSVLTIQSKTVISSVRLVDVMGRASLTKTQVNSNQATLQVSPLATGVYFVEVIDVQGHISLQKIVKH